MFTILKNTNITLRMKKIFYLGLIIHILLLTTSCANDNNDEEIIQLLPQITEQEERERVEQE